jgi:hypothetical protein
MDRSRSGSQNGRSFFQSGPPITVTTRDRASTIQYSRTPLFKYRFLLAAIAKRGALRQYLDDQIGDDAPELAPPGTRARRPARVRDVRRVRLQRVSGGQRVALAGR